MRSGDGLRPGEGVVTRWITSHGHDCPAQQILAGVLRGKYLKESSPASLSPVTLSPAQLSLGNQRVH